MITKHKTVLATVWVFLTLATASAQQQVPQAMKDLLTLEGCWVGDAKMVADGQTFMFKYYADCKQAAMD